MALKSKAQLSRVEKNAMRKGLKTMEDINEWLMLLSD